MKKRYYETERECIDFFREEYEFLSNFYPACMTYGGIDYYNSEAAYQAQKCRDRRMCHRFSNLTADESKRLGRTVEVRTDWEEIRVSVMTSVVEEKFRQNPALAVKLAETGEKKLKEGNYWKDFFWGVDLRTGQGENHLGRILMGLRGKYKREGIPDQSRKPDRKRYGPIFGMNVEFGDITQSDCMCIVNAAERDLMGGSGVDGAIHREAGEGLREECRALNGCETGCAKITGGHHLFAEYVIHAVGPHYGETGDEVLLRSCYQNCMDIVRQYDINSVAFPALSTGKFSYPKRQAVEIAVEEVSAWMTRHEDYPVRVVFTCVDPAIYEYFCENLNAMKSKKFNVGKEYTGRVSEVRDAAGKE